MQFSRQQRRPGNDVHILSLVSIIFLLIIFFMVVGRISTPGALAIKPPHSVSETPARNTGLLVQVNTQGRIALDGNPVAPKQLKSSVRDYLARQPDGVIRLKADGLTDASRVVAIMTVLREAGAKRVRLLTTEAGR